MATSDAQAAAAKLLADEGDEAAQFVYGYCFWWGDGVEIDEMQV
jgi:hypothetical protein